MTSIAKRLLAIVFVSVLVLSGPSCSSSGCRDVNALNYDPDAPSDGVCRFTNVIFYASSNRVGGTAERLTKIEVFLLSVGTEELLGTIDGLSDEHPAPQGCTAPEKAIEFRIQSSAPPTRFTTRYYYEDGSDEAGDLYEFSPERLTECLVQKLTL